MKLYTYVSEKFSFTEQTYIDVYKSSIDNVLTNFLNSINDEFCSKLIKLTDLDKGLHLEKRRDIVSMWIEYPLNSLPYNLSVVRFLHGRGDTTSRFFAHRSSWKNEHFFIGFHNGQLTQAAYYSLCPTEPLLWEGIYTPTENDLVADDWSIYTL